MKERLGRVDHHDVKIPIQASMLKTIVQDEDGSALPPGNFVADLAAIRGDADPRPRNSPANQARLVPYHSRRRRTRVSRRQHVE